MKFIAKVDFPVKKNEVFEVEEDSVVSTLRESAAKALVVAICHHLVFRSFLVCHVHPTSFFPGSLFFDCRLQDCS